MDKPDLSNILQQLHGALDNVEQETGELDNSTREMLEKVQQDIDRLLHAEGEIGGQEVRSVSQRLNEALLDFETEHPQITSLLSRLGDALANLGI